jgi:hypothetical protein
MLHWIGFGQYGQAGLRERLKRICDCLHYQPARSREVSMSVVVDSALSVERPMTMSSDGMWIPMLGGLWVATNVGLVGLGMYIHLPGACSFLAGLINGTLLSVVAVMMASERFQAGTTGLLGGLSLSGLRSDGSMVSKAMQGIHSFVDSALHAIGIDGSENLHHAIEQEALCIVWTTLFVVMASLVVEWVRASRRRQENRS